MRENFVKQLVYKRTRVFLKVGLCECASTSTKYTKSPRTFVTRITLAPTFTPPKAHRRHCSNSVSALCLQFSSLFSSASHRPPCNAHGFIDAVAPRPCNGEQHSANGNVARTTGSLSLAANGAVCSISADFDRKNLHRCSPTRNCARHNWNRRFPATYLRRRAQPSARTAKEYWFCFLTSNDSPQKRRFDGALVIVSVTGVQVLVVASAFVVLCEKVSCALW